ncbi:type IV conjugative transfer system lipoprotein TraV (plasmid) [Pectobacteriaceae bacterium CE70]|nr:type IV conjugative transfer system lipoprotein TraV [Prodigiosinella sp. LS101]WJV60591.1 type IV conjugative transfer system lipoprotein TraV [Pectobacteriaceae bacterium C111]WJV64873.1 type IV conjugative transfer system lipoprotein TraV [Pectobacteriaceae bacterium C52]WJV69195.1 type IV conjugative transfer system lipoprotein TraV [Pectobacteriaceae bacterium CE70]WJY13122.1 type IV conjugative transfer system lipoprotein TraV [Pectobacteriaceae bacterium C80]WJY17415.1 type IV conjug
MHKFLPVVLLGGMLTGCAGMNSDFDCNKTATDQCLSMSDASHLAAKGKSLDDLTAEAQTVPKPAAESLASTTNIKPNVSPDRPISVAGLAPRPIAGTPVSNNDAMLRASTIPVAGSNTRSLSAIRPITPADYAGPGQVDARRIPDATQRLWIAPWVDEQDSFHQPAVVEFVKNKSRWDADFRVISEGE